MTLGHKIEKCDECGANKVVGYDCLTPHCKAIREEGGN